MSFEPRDYLRHILVEAEYLIDVVQTRVPELRNQLASILKA